MSTLVAASPELKRLWIRALKRVHRGLAVEEQGRLRDWLTNQGNDADAGRDEVALTAILEPRALPPDVWEALAQAQQGAPPQSTPQPPLGPQHPLIVSGRAAVGILWPAFAVLCLLLSVIFDTLSETVGRYTSLSLLVLLTGAVLWLITRNSRLTSTKKPGGSGSRKRNDPGRDKPFWQSSQSKSTVFIHPRRNCSGSGGERQRQRVP